MIVTTNREMVISRATKVAREEVIIMVAIMAAIINVGEGMINPVGGQPGTCSYPGYLLWTLTEQEQFPPPHFRTIPLHIPLLTLNVIDAYTS